MVRAFGKERAKILGRRLKAMRDIAETLDDLRNMPGRTHELSGDLEGHLAISLDGPYRLIFAPTTWPAHDAGGLDWTKVDSVVVVGIENYHD